MPCNSSWDDPDGLGGLATQCKVGRPRANECFVPGERAIRVRCGRNGTGLGIGLLVLDVPFLLVRVYNQTSCTDRQPHGIASAVQPPTPNKRSEKQERPPSVPMWEQEQKSGHLSLSGAHRPIIPHAPRSPPVLAAGLRVGMGARQGLSSLRFLRPKRGEKPAFQPKPWESPPGLPNILLHAPRSTPHDAPAPLSPPTPCSALLG